MDITSNNETIKFRVTQADKEKIQNDAKKYGVTVSAYIRTVMLSNEKICVLANGNEIAAQLFAVSQSLENLSTKSCISMGDIDKLRDILQNISDNLFNISEKLDELRTEEGGEE